MEENLSITPYANTRMCITLKNGDLTKQRKRREDNGPMDCSFFSCINSDFLTDCELNVTVPKDSKIIISQINGRYYIL